jgi:16S rRNA (guanine527-N7)-methyltransferase
MLFPQRFTSHDIVASIAFSLNGLQTQMPTDAERFAVALSRHAPKFKVKVGDDVIARLRDYYNLLMKWNARLHLVAPCSPEELATRHVLESLMLLPDLSPGAHMIDVGPGGGLPSIPCLLARSDIHAMLIESSKRKAVFLREALGELDLANRAEVLDARFQDVAAPAADVLTCRALEQFEKSLPKLIEWAPAGSTLLLFGGERLLSALQQLLPGAQGELIPGSQRRFLIIAPAN